MPTWDEMLPDGGPAARLDGPRIDAYLSAAAEVVLDARNHDDLDRASPVLGREALEFARRADGAAAASPNRHHRDDNAVTVLEGLQVRPVGVVLGPGCVQLRARLVHLGHRVDTGEPLRWEELWVLEVPYAATGPVRQWSCPPCGAPRTSVHPCRFCGSVAQPAELAESVWRVVERRPV